MPLLHRLCGYEIPSDEPFWVFDLSGPMIADAYRIAKADPDPRAGEGSYPISHEAASEITAILGAPVEVEEYRWELEVVIV